MAEVMAPAKEPQEIPHLPFMLRYSTEILSVLILLSFGLWIFSNWFALLGLFFIVLMWWNRNFNPAVRRYIDTIESRDPLPGPEDPGVVGYKIAHGMMLRDHYKNVPEHLRRKSYFGKCD